MSQNRQKILGELDIGSAISADEAITLVRLAKKVAKPGTILVEIGSWKGYSASILAGVAKELGGHIYCVDHWKGSETAGSIPEAKDKDIFALFNFNLWALGLLDYVTPISKASVYASNDFKDRSIDFLFIDADHRYKQFKEDLVAWLPKVKVGGIICGHDCEQYYSEAFPELKERLNKNLDIDFDGNYHCGVIKGLYDFFGDDYKLKARIWFRETDGNSA